jgi:calreticulin
MKVAALAIVLLFALTVSAEVFFSEEFKDGDGWKNRWVVSQSKEADGTAGQWGISAGKYFNDAEEDKGLQTTQDARFYQISSEIKEFSNKGKTLVLQFSIKHEQNIDCGGGYVKLLPAGLNQERFNGDSEYNIMFGPDICGSTKRVHVIFNYKGKNHLISKEIRAESDTHTHLYTLIVNPDQTFKVLIDNKEVRAGSLPADWDFLPPKEIKDPSKSKPSDWVDDKEIVDPEAKKPEGWDDIPAQIKDPDAQKPDDWDDELDGEWEAPLIDNPEYKGEWKAPKIPNPEYKGEWVHPLIPNPDYAEDSEIYAYPSHKYVGIEIWQVKSGTIFDNFLVTDSVETAAEWAEKTLKTREGEKAAEDKDLEEKRKNAPAPEDDEEIGEGIELDDESIEGEDFHDEL